MHAYVFWRASSVPLIKKHFSNKVIAFSGLLLCSVFLIARTLRHDASGRLTVLLELFSMNWMAVLFLTTIFLLFAEAATCFGALFRRRAPFLRGLALAAGAAASAFALFQGMRPPIVEHYEVYMDELPEELDGVVAAAMSDMHLGETLDGEWLAARVEQAMAEKPDIVFLLGDIFEGHGSPDEKLLPVLRRLSAPLGVWGVAGNHEFYGGGDGNISFLENAGVRMLKDEWSQVRPGLVVAGVNSHWRSRTKPVTGGVGGSMDDGMIRALDNLPPGAVIFLSHRPLRAEEAAKAGVDLMLSGHTHGGQLWPFNFLVKQDYPLLAGRYEVNGMTVIVSRGAGTWGPRMRLWRPGDILSLTLRRGDKNKMSVP